MSPVPIHYLRPNDKVWTPSAVLFFDTETRVIPDTEPEVLGLRLWTATLVRRRSKRRGGPSLLHADGTTAAELASFVNGCSRGEPTLWAYAHNLAFDLTTTRLPIELGAHRWAVTDFSVTGPSPWFRMRRGGHRLCLTDSWSWLPHALETIGEALRIDKLELPDETEGDGAWGDRCRVDTLILATAICQLMDWWDGQRLGRWSITGAACGWNAFRHVPSPRRILIDPDPSGIKFDRLAIRGGRREAWKIGVFKNGPFAELDITAAHPTIAAELPLPCGRGRRFDSQPLDTKLIGGDRWGIIAEALVSTSVPRWPLRLHGATWWPVGTFRTILAGPELAEARALGQLLEIGPGYVHRLGRALTPWARWCLALQDGELADTPPVARLAGKAWGRSVIGKWAGRTHRTLRLGDAPRPGWGLERGWNHTAKTRGAMVDLNGQRWWTTSDQEPDNSYPAILAWVESALRMRLGRVIDAIGEGPLLQCDTDGLLVSVPRWEASHHRYRGDRRDPLAHRRQLHAMVSDLAPLVAPLTIRVKHLFRSAVVIGPQHLELGDDHRFAGIRRDAIQVRPGEWEARGWPRMGWQLENGSELGYARPLLKTKLVGPYVNRWQLANGTLDPPQARLDADGRSELVPWSELAPRPPFDLPAADQYGYLKRLLDTKAWLSA